MRPELNRVSDRIFARPECIGKVTTDDDYFLRARCIVRRKDSSSYEPETECLKVFVRDGEVAWLWVERPQYASCAS